MRKTRLIVVALMRLNLIAHAYTYGGLPEGATMRLEKGTIVEMQYSPDGSMLAVATLMGIWLYDTTTLAEVDLLDDNRLWALTLAFSPDGKSLAAGSLEGDVRLWDTRTGKLRRILTGHTSVVNSVAFSPDGKTIASGSHDKTARLWDAGTGKLRFVLSGHSGPILTVAFSPDGMTLASCGWDSGTRLRMWDVKTGNSQRILNRRFSGVRSVAFHTGGNILAIGTGYSNVQLWNPKTGEYVHTLTGHAKRVYDVAFSPNGKKLASASADNTVRLWNMSTCELEHILTGHPETVGSVAFSPDGRTLASGSRDGTVLFWELAPPLIVDALVGDVNGDRLVNLADLASVGQRIGETGDSDADVDGDRVVNIYDLVHVAGAIGDAKPSADTLAASSFSAAEVEGWLNQARGLDLTDPKTQRGIRFLERLLSGFLPKKTALLQNYPNPFNPETWIPYHLAREVGVAILIYDTKGTLVRRLALGYRAAGYYADRGRAAYWDGRNEDGESVASGVYFYRLRAGDFAASRRMVIVK